MRPDSVGNSIEEKVSAYKTRIGIRMLIFYTATYAGFIAINTLIPALMEKSFGGLNLAILYGFGLIVFAFVLACIYNHFCTAAEKRLRR